MKMISNNSLSGTKRRGRRKPGVYGWIFVLLTWFVWGVGSLQAAGATADFNNDGTVDFPDLIVFISQWLQNDPNINDGSFCVSNFNQDGIVDFSDFAVFAAQWQGRMITISGMTGVGGVTLIGLPGNPISQSNGYYSALVPYGWGGTITPTREGYSFSPESVSYTFITADMPDRDFSITQVVTFTISGTTGTGGVTMNGLPDTPVSDSNGYYSAVVPYGWAGTVTPTKTGYTFSPSSISYTLVTSDLSDRNFIATEVTNVTISGTTGVDGVTLDGLPDTPISGSNGYYYVVVPYGWNGIVTPVKAGYSFSPENMSFTSVTSDLSNRDFSIAHVVTFTISGTTGTTGVSMNGLPGNPVSDSNGQYSAVVPYGWSGMVTPTKAGYSFSPESVSYTSVTADMPNRNFSVTQVVTFTISGTTGTGGVTVDGLPGNPVSDGNGYYSAVVPYGWAGTVTPTKTGYTFSPSSSSYTLVTADLSDQNFTAAQMTSVTISGTTGVDGVAMNGLPGNPVSDSSGFYSVAVPYDWSGTVTPKKPGYSFSPENMSYTYVASDLSDRNFTATQLPSVMVAASDAPEGFKAESNFICDGINDQEEINAALGNNRRVILSSGTFNITGMVEINYNYIVLDGQGPSTVLKNMSSARYCVIYQFGANHDIAIRNLQIDNNDYGDAADAWNKCLFINGNYTTVIGSDHNKYFCLKAHIANSDNRPVTGPNFTTYWSRVSGTGTRETWAEGQSYTGIDSCNNILIEGVTAHDSRAEVICVDYAEYITIRGCYTYNGAWSGITVAHTKHSSIYNNNVEHCGELPKAGYQMARGINSIGSVDVSIYNNWIRDCMSGGIGVNETSGIVESDNINIYDNHIINTIGASGGIVVESSDHGSYSTNVKIHDNSINTDRHAKLDAGGSVVDNSDGTVTLPATYNGYRTGLSVKIEGTANYNGTFTLQNGTDDNHIVISHVYIEELFNGTETVSQAIIGIWFEYVKNFNVSNNIFVPGVVNTGTYWCYVTTTAFDGLVQYNTYTPGKTYVNKGISVIFNGNGPIAP